MDTQFTCLAPLTLESSVNSVVITVGIGVVYDNKSTVSFDSTSQSVSHTCTGTNRFLVVAIVTEDNDNTVTALSYAGQSFVANLAKRVTGSSDYTTNIYYLANPASGANNISVTLSNGDDAAIMAVSYTGVRQITPLDNTDGTEDSSSPWGGAITTDYANELIVFAASDSGNSASIREPVALSNERHDILAGSGIGDFGGYFSDRIATTATSYTLTYSTDGDLSPSVWAMATFQAVGNILTLAPSSQTISSSVNSVTVSTTGGSVTPTPSTISLVSSINVLGITSHNRISVSTVTLASSVLTITLVTKNTISVSNVPATFSLNSLTAKGYANTGPPTPAAVTSSVLSVTVLATGGSVVVYPSTVSITSSLGTSSISGAYPILYNDEFVTLDSGENLIHGALIFNNKLYCVTRTNPCKLIVFNDLDDLTNRTDYTFPSDGYHNQGESIVYSATNDRLYIMFDNGSSRIEVSEVDPDNLTTHTDVIVNTSAGAGGSAPMVTDSTYLYILSNLTPSIIYKYALSDFSLVDSETLPNGLGHAMCFDGTYIYCTGHPGPGWVSKINPLDLSEIHAHFSSGGENTPTDDMAEYGDYLWVGLENIGHPLLKIAKSDLTITRITIDSTNFSTYSVIFDGGYIWTADLRSPSRMYRIHPITDEVTPFILESGVNTVNELVTYNTDLYATCWLSPAKIARINTTAYTCVVYNSVTISLLTPTVTGAQTIIPVSSLSLVSSTETVSITAVAGGNWLTGWDYRKKVTVNSATGAGTYYQVKLKIDSTTGGSGNFHLEGHSADFFGAYDDSGDICFTTSDGSTLIDFWVESYDGSGVPTATVWVEIPSDLSSSNVDIYCYYGNDASGLANVSNGTNTFLAYDDFEDNNLTGWTERDPISCTWSTSTSYVKDGSYGVQAQMGSNGDGGILTWDASTFESCRIEAWVRLPDADTLANVQGGFVYAWADNSNYYMMKIVDSDTGPTEQLELRELTGGSGATRGTNLFTVSASTFYKLTILAVKSGSDLIIKGYVDDAEEVSYTDTSPRTTPNYVGFFCSYTSANRAWFDTFRVGKYVATEPVFSSADSEEEGPGDALVSVSALSLVSSIVSSSIVSYNIFSVSTVTLVSSIETVTVGAGLLISLSPLAIGTALNIDYTQHTNCVGAWLFREGSGITIEDSSINTNTGNFRASGQPAWLSSSLPKPYTTWVGHFDGNDDYINCGSSASLDNELPGTIVAWVYPEGLGGNDQGRILAKDNGSTGRWLTAMIGPAVSGCRFQVNHPRATTHTYATSSDYPLNNWYHVAFYLTTSTDSSLMKIYVNGVYDRAYNSDGSGTSYTDDSAETMYIGNRSDEARAFDGYIGEVAFFDTELTQSQINEIRGNSLKPLGTALAISGDAVIIVDALSIASSVITPTILAGGNVNVSSETVSIVSSLGSPSINTNVLIALSAVTLISSLDIPSILTTEAVLVSPTTISLTSSILSPTVSGKAILLISAISIVSSINSSTLIGNSIISGSTVSIVSSLGTPTISGKCLVTLSTLTLSSSLVSPSILTGGNVSISISTVSITSSVADVDILAIKNVSFSVSTVSLLFSINAVTIGAGCLISVNIVSLASSINNVSIISSSRISSESVSLTLSVLTPSVNIGGSVHVNVDSVTVSSSLATLTLSTKNIVSVNSFTITSSLNTISIAGKSKVESDIVSVTSSLTTASILTNVRISVSTLSITSAIQTVIIGGVILISVNTVSVASSLVSPTLITKAIILISELMTLTSSLVSPTLSSGIKVSVSTNSLTIIQQSPTLSGNGNILLSAVSIVSAINNVSLKTNLRLDVAVVSINSQILTVVIAGVPVSISCPVLTLTSTVNSVTVSRYIWGRILRTHIDNYCNMAIKIKSFNCNIYIRTGNYCNQQVRLRDNVLQKIRIKDYSQQLVGVN